MKDTFIKQASPFRVANLIMVSPFLLYFLVIAISFGCHQANTQNPASDPSINGYVPDKATAERIAEAIWLPIYGEKVLQQHPLQTTLSGDSLWIVQGSLPEGMLGGTAYIEIMKADGRILKVTHGK